MICRDGLVGAAGQTAPTKGYEPPIKNVSVVVMNANCARILIIRENGGERMGWAS